MAEPIGNKAPAGLAAYWLKDAAKRHVIDHFRKPRGLAGWLAGSIMAVRPSNRRRNARTVGLLDLRPHHRVLEIGFGPGLALEACCERIRNGAVVGLDHSRTMHAMAAVRNRRSIAAGRLSLRLGSTEELVGGTDPVLAGPFDRIFGVNVVMFWSDPAATLHAIFGRLAPGGQVALTVQPRCGERTDAAVEAAARRIAEALRTAGLRDIRT